MKKIKLLLLALIMLSITGCKKKSISNNIVKDGQTYTMDNISFYYPNQYEIKSESTNEVVLGLDDTSLTFEKRLITEGNKENELIQLFRLDLENEGYSIASNASITLENGDACQEIVYEKDDMKAKTLVVIDSNEMITLSYSTDKDTYEDSISSINYYLYSLSVIEEEEMVAVANS